MKVDDDVMDNNGNPDIEKIKPFLYDPAFMAYYGIGKRLAKAFSIGREVME